jgi:hypothetical protein
VQGILHHSLYVLAPNVSASVHSIEHKSVFNDARYTEFGYNFKKAHDSVMRVVLCNILIEFGVP